MIFFVAQAASAGGLYENMKIAVGDTKLSSDPITFVGAIVKGLLSLLGVALVLVLIYAGIIWGFLSANDPKKIQTAKDMIKNAVIGLVIVFAAYAVTSFILDSLNKTTTAASRPASVSIIPSGTMPF